jgi:hypothetical protein
MNRTRRKRERLARESQNIRDDRGMTICDCATCGTPTPLGWEALVLVRWIDTVRHHGRFIGHAWHEWEETRRAPIKKRKWICGSCHAMGERKGFCYPILPDNERRPTYSVRVERWAEITGHHAERATTRTIKVSGAKDGRYAVSPGGIAASAKSLARLAEWKRKKAVPR